MDKTDCKNPRCTDVACPVHFPFVIINIEEVREEDQRLERLREVCDA